MQAVDRLDDAVNLQKQKGQSATIRILTLKGQFGEERFPMQVPDSTGAGDWNRTELPRQFAKSLTGSYEGGQPPCTIPVKRADPLQNSQVPGSICSFGAGDWNRTSDLRFTNRLRSKPHPPKPPQNNNRCLIRPANRWL